MKAAVETREIRGHELKVGDSMEFFSQPRVVTGFEDYTGPLAYCLGEARIALSPGGFRITIPNDCTVRIYAAAPTPADS